MERVVRTSQEGVFDHVDAKALCQAYRFAVGALAMTYVVNPIDRDRLAAALLATFAVQKGRGDVRRYDAVWLANASLDRFHDTNVLRPKLQFAADNLL